MNTVNAYEALYTNMKNRFTVVNDNSEYTLGEYMLMKAGKKKEKSNLPVASNRSLTANTVTSFFKYVNDKLTVKNPPVKDKIIKKFPFRTSVAALMSAIVACTLIITYGTVTLKSVTNDTPSTVQVESAERDTNLEHSYTTKK